MAQVNRNQALDVLRGVAILLVLGFHYSYFHWWWQIGWTGVDLFFVLSGFLISGLLFNEYRSTGRINLCRFWIRRGFKIYPPYYILMSLTAVSFAATRGHEPRAILSEVFFVQNYFPHIWQHTWSLAVEEHFYFTLPLLLILLIRLEAIHSIRWVFALVAAGCLAMRIAAYTHGISPAAIHEETHMRIDPLFFGVALRHWKEFNPQGFQRAAKKPLWLGVALLFPAFFLPPAGAFMDTIGLTLLYVGFGLMLVWAVERPASNVAPFRILEWIGRSSYSIYLWHLPLWALLFRGRVTFGFFAEGLTVSIFFGWAMARMVEKPSLMIRDKMFPQILGGAGKGKKRASICRYGNAAAD